MIQCICTDRIKDKNNRVIKYIISDTNGSSITVNRDELKNAIIKGKVEVKNIKIDKAGRLIYTEIKDNNTYSVIDYDLIQNIKGTINSSNINSKDLNLIFRVNVDIKNMIAKSKILDIHIIYYNDIVCIFTNTHLYICTDKSKFKILDAESLFRETMFKTMVFENIDMSDCENMESMFASVRTELLDISKLDKSNIVNMSSLFASSRIDELKFGTFNLSKLRNANSMFRGAVIKSDITIKNVYFKELLLLNSIFSNSIIKSVVLHNLDLSHCEWTMNAIYYCAMESLEIINCKFSEKCITDEMFYNCRTKLKTDSTKIMELYKKYNKQ